MVLQLKGRPYLSYFSLFTSASTLLCCALPALLVALGMGASLAGLVAGFPQIVWVSEHKTSVFGVAAAALIVAGLLQWRGRNLPCPIDPAQAQACASARRWSQWVYWTSVLIYLVGAGFAFVAPLISDA